MDENYDLKISGPIKDSLTEYPQYLIEEFLNDNKEGAKYVSCTSIKQIQITCSELSLKKHIDRNGIKISVLIGTQAKR